MADKWLKLSYDIYATFNSGEYYPTAVGSSLSSDKFLRQPLYQNNYGWGGIAWALRLPAKMRIYQLQVTFNDSIFFEMMTAGRTNYVAAYSTPDSVPQINIDPTSSETSYESELGTENTYTRLQSGTYCSEGDFEMQSQKAATSSGTASFTYNIIFQFHDNETSEYEALLAAYPNNVTVYNPFPPEPVHDLYVGDEQVSVLYHGDERIDKVYLGDKVVLLNLD